MTYVFKHKLTGETLVVAVDSEREGMKDAQVKALRQFNGPLNNIAHLQFIKIICKEEMQHV